MREEKVFYLPSELCVSELLLLLFLLLSMPLPFLLPLLLFFCRRVSETQHFKLCFKSKFFLLFL